MSQDINVDFSPLKLPDYVGDATNAFQVGRKLAAQQISGNAMQAYMANPSAPIDPRLGAADPQTALALQDRQRQTAALAANQNAAQKLGQGDFSGAVATPGLSVEQVAEISKTHSQMTTDQLTQAAKTHEILANGAIGLIHSVPMAPGADPQQVMAQRKAAALHTLQTSGFPAPMLAAAEQQDYSDAGLQQMAQSNIDAGKQAEMAIEAAKNAETARHNQAGEGETARHNKADEGTARAHLGIDAGQLAVSRDRLALDQSTQLTPDSIDNIAHQFILTGQMPALGMRSQAARAAIVNRASEIQKQTGQTGADAVLTHLNTKAAGSALAAQTKQQAFTESAARTANGSADMVLQLAPKGGGQTGAPVVNRWLQAGRKSIAGDPDVTNFNAALGTLSEEYAKVMTGSTGSQAATDSARNAAADRLDRAATQGQIQGVVKVMRQEMEIRRKAMADQIDATRHSVSGGGAQPAPAPAQSGGVRYIGEAN